MSDIIQVNYEALQRIAKDFHQESEEIARLRRDTGQKMDTLRNDWVGRAANTFFMEMESEILPSTERLVRALLISEDSLNQIARIFHDADMETTSYYNFDGEAIPPTDGTGIGGQAPVLSPPYGPPGESGAPSTGWGIDFSFSSTAIIDWVNFLGDQVGISDLSAGYSQFLSWAALGLDSAAWGCDAVATGIVALGTVIGATGGVVVTGGTTSPITGPAGAMIAWGLTEIGVQPLIQTGNALATFATLATVQSDFLSGANRIDLDLHIGQDGFAFNRETTIAPGTQVSVAATTYGWLAPLSVLSLAGQSVSVGADIMGLTSGLPLPPLNENVSISGSSTHFDFQYQVDYGNWFQFKLDDSTLGGLLE